MKREPIRHHYIPQFILRNFCDEKGYVNYFDKTTNKITLREPSDIFMEKNLYRDEINYAENPTKIETDLARFESDISQIIKEKFLVGDKVILTKEDEQIKLFFFIMGFRSHNAMLQFSEGLSKDSIVMYSMYQKNENFHDLWKRNVYNKPQWNAKEESISIRVKKLYPEEVQEINSSIENAVKIGFVFQKDK